MRKVKYNYIFFSIDNSFYSTIYHGFSTNPGLCLVRMPAVFPIPGLIRKLSNWRLPFPWARAEIMGRLYNYSQIAKLVDIKPAKKNTKNCYIIYARLLEIYGPGLLTYLKKADKNGVYICYLGDVSDSFTFNIKDIKEKCDVVFSCDRKDAKKNNILFLQAPYSLIKPQSNNIKYDVLFVGSAKNRLDKIITAYELLEKNGFSSVFYITDVEENRKRYKEKIHYNHYLNYEEVLSLLFQSKCVLEILQEDADSTTTRYSEAMVYKKYLLTDSKYLREQKENPSNIICLDYSDNTDFERIRQALDFDNTKYLNELSIKTMVKTIESCLKDQLQS